MASLSSSSFFLTSAREMLHYCRIEGFAITLPVKLTEGGGWWALMNCLIGHPSVLPLSAVHTAIQPCMV